MESETPNELYELAKRTLGMSTTASNSEISTAYLDEIKTHKQLYQHDFNFLLFPEPGTGFGKVKCLEKGCEGVIVPLSKKSKTADGGKGEGIGALVEYRYHIAEHPTHSRNRYVRIKADYAAKNLRPTGATPLSVSGSRPTPPGNQPRSLLAALDAMPSASQRSSQPAGASTSPAALHKGSSSLVRVKPEQLETSLSMSSPHTPTTGNKPRVSGLQRIKSDAPGQELVRKRLSDSTFEPSLPSDLASGDPPAAKRIRSDNFAVTGQPKTPLGPVNRDLIQASTALVPVNNVTPLPSAIDLEDLRGKMVDLQREISQVEPAYYKLVAKRKPTKADRTRQANLSALLSKLRLQKDQLNAQIPAAAPYQPQTLASSYASAPQAPVQVAQQALPMPGAYPFVASTPVQPGAIQPYVVPQALAALKVEPTQTTLDPHLRPLHNQNAELDEPVASGSGTPQVLARGKLPELDSDSDEGDYNYPDPADIYNRIIPNIPIMAPLANANNFDENGDWHGRGKDMFRGPVAKADDIEKFLKEAGNAELFDGNARIDKALEKLDLPTLVSLIPGMEIALMPHQVIGVAWMVEKEKSSHKGGCLGDDMGLGKTVQMIATMLKNRSDDPACKTNLILSPTALLDQWKMEIEMKTNCDLKVLIYHGSSKPRRKTELLKYDVVLTTYATMAMEWPDFENEQKKKEKARQKRKRRQDGFIEHDSDEDSEDYKPRKKKESGMLFQIDFYRIILDEAQAIRNRRTRASRAVTDLRSKYRWCLTGTPIINALVDCYGYFRFLKIRPWYDFTEFQAHVGVYEKKNPSLAASRLQAILASVLLRRMKDSKLDGQPLIDLPEKTVNLVKLEFTEEEKEIYDMVERGAQASFNRFLRAGTVLKNYSQVLVLLLRLRQICSHPSLIQENAAAFISPDDVYEEKSPQLTTELIRARRLVGPDFVQKIKLKFKAAALQRMEAEQASADAVAEDEECPICYDGLTDAVITPCAHSFCRECITDVLNRPVPANADESTAMKADERACPTCRGVISADKLFGREAFLPTDDDLNPKLEDSDIEMKEVGVSRRSTRSKRKGKAIKKRSGRPANSVNVLMSEPESDEEDDHDDDLSDFIVEDGEDEEEKDARRALKNRRGKKRANVIIDSDDEVEAPEEKEIYFGTKTERVSPAQIKLLPRFLPSTKMKYMMQQLEKMMDDRPDEKVLIISQWTSCLDLVSDYLSEADVIHVKYQGDMTRPKRELAVRAFMSKGKAKVMLMSMKCGGVGLNLTRANNVLSLDLGWSQAIENQSFDRVHRLGQSKPVLVERLVISGTVEDRVLTMQERKKLLSDGSLGEGSAKKMGRLSVRQLANLFGLDHRGRRLEGDDA